jgi:hypothetical protein
LKLSSPDKFFPVILAAIEVVELIQTAVALILVGAGSWLWRRANHPPPIAN